MQPREKGFIQRQVGGINGHARGELLFQQRPSTRPPEENLEYGKRIPAQESRERFPHHVGADERAVEVNDERNIFRIGHARMLRIAAAAGKALVQQRQSSRRQPEIGLTGNVEVFRFATLKRSWAGSPACESRRHKSFRLFCSPEPEPQPREMCYER